LLEIHDQIKQSKEEIRYNSSNPQHILIMAYYCTIIASTDSCIFLYKSGKFLCIPVIARNMLEALVDLIDITKNPNYPKNLLASHYCHIKKILNPENRNGNNVLASPEFGQKYEEALKELERLKKAKITPLKEENKFLKADIPEVYTLYRHLCQYSHNNIIALEERHIDKVNNRIICFKNYSDEEKQVFLYYIYSILRVAFKQIQQYFDLKNSKFTKKVAELSFCYDQMLTKSQSR